MVKSGEKWLTVGESGQQFEKVVKMVKSGEKW